MSNEKHTDIVRNYVNEYEWTDREIERESEGKREKERE